jgi:hypothetical protein
MTGGTRPSAVASGEAHYSDALGCLSAGLRSGGCSGDRATEIMGHDRTSQDGVDG